MQAMGFFLRVGLKEPFQLCELQVVKNIAP